MIRVENDQGLPRAGNGLKRDSIREFGGCECDEMIIYLDYSGGYTTMHLSKFIEPYTRKGEF